MNRWDMQCGALIGSLCLVACGPSSTDDDDESTGSDLAAMAVSNVEQALRGTHRAGSFIADSATIADSLSGTSEYCSTSCSIDNVCTTECVEEEDPVTVADLQEGRDELNESIDELVKTLKEKIFSAENLESESGGAATYLLGPKTMCSSSSSSGTIDDAPLPGVGGTGAMPPPVEPELDPECVDQMNRLQPRLRLSSPGGGNVDVELLLTSSRHNPVTLELYTNHVGLVVDLGATKATLDSVGEDTGTISEMVGQLGLELRRNGDLDYSLRGSVLESVSIGLTNDVGEELHYGVAKSVPTMELRLDGNARQITGSVDYGAITLGGPLNAFKDTFDPLEYDAVTGAELPRPTYTGALELLLAGVEGSVTFDGSTDKVTLNELGLGDASSTLKLDGQTLAQLDVNPNAGRHFDVTLEKQTGGSLVTFSPTLDASVLLNFAPLAAQIPDIAPDLLNNALHLWFDGTNPSVESHEEQLKVVSGTLHFTNAYDPTQDFTASAGQCVSLADVDATASEGVTGVLVTTCE